jgi:molybdate/tungstate transport system substrate-binding protein
VCCRNEERNTTVTRYFLLTSLFLLLISGCGKRQSEIIIFHAGSLSVPLRALADEFEKSHPAVKILMEPAGSLVCARKITELKKPCDILVSADYFVIDKIIVPEYASWSIRFATNEIVIAFDEKSKYSGEIDSVNWMDILLRDDVSYARSDPDSDPCGYRTVLTFMLAENHYRRQGLSKALQVKDRKFIRPKEIDLIALIESNAVDYMFQYKSVAIQHKLKYVELPDEINLGNPGLNHLYNTVSINVVGSSPGSSITIRGGYINYSLSVPDKAPNQESAVDFTEYLLSPEGMDVFRKNGQEPIIPVSTGQPDIIPWKLRKYIMDR